MYPAINSTVPISPIIIQVIMTHMLMPRNKWLAVYTRHYEITGIFGIFLEHKLLD